jgi:hypothetical protein
LEPDKWESGADPKIREAMDAGFLIVSPTAVSRFARPESQWMAHDLLRVNGFAPPEIEEARDIEG